MLERYKTVYRGKEGEIIEKKSRFIATVRLVETEEEALAFIEEMKKKYWNATHNCFAYVIGERRECVRCSDDGEPSGTAGKPMLDVQYGSCRDKIFWRHASGNRRTGTRVFEGGAGRTGAERSDRKTVWKYPRDRDRL